MTMFVCSRDLSKRIRHSFFFFEQMTRRFAH